jgi:hypothetical protein
MQLYVPPGKAGRACLESRRIGGTSNGYGVEDWKLLSVIRRWSGSNVLTLLSPPNACIQPNHNFHGQPYIPVGTT